MPELHNTIVLNLLFDLATWHSYAKLRKNTKHTVNSLHSQSKELGRQLHIFLRQTCSQYKTKPLPGETTAHGHRHVASARKGTATTQKKPKPWDKPATEGESDLRPFNLATYKIHALTNYADQIKRFRPTNCFTTQHICHHSIPTEPTSDRTLRVSLNTRG